MGSSRPLGGLLLALDLDGTLTQADGAVGGRTLDALRAARLDGARVGLFTRRASGFLRRRHPALLDVLDIVSCGGGAYLFDPRTGEEELLAGLPARLCRELDTVIREPRAPDVALEHGGVFVCDRGFEPPGHWEPADAFRGRGDPIVAPVTTIYLQGRAEAGGPWRERLPAAGTGAVMLAMDDQMIKYEPDGVSKGGSLAPAVQALGGQEPTTVVAVGNAHDDLALFAVADFSYCVADAHPDLWAAATRLPETSAEHAVAALLEGEILRTLLPRGRKR